jgi:hypothetical protein
VRVDLIARTSSSLAGVSPVRVAARSAVADQLGVHRAFRRALSGRAPAGQRSPRLESEDSTAARPDVDSPRLDVGPATSKSATVNTDPAEPSTHKPAEP